MRAKARGAAAMAADGKGAAQVCSCDAKDMLIHVDKVGSENSVRACRHQENGMTFCLGRLLHVLALSVVIVPDSIFPKNTQVCIIFKWMGNYREKP